MAKRPVFFEENGVVKSTDIDFQWFAGFAVSQKQKSIKALHDAIREKYPDANPMEISTKGTVALGNKLSAFNLKLHGYYLENVFQSSKVFTDSDGPHLEWLELHPKEAKREAGKLHDEGHRLLAFRYDGTEYPLEPKTVFYDHIYYMAVRDTLSKEDLDELAQFNYFTDIEFPPQRSINTQARSVVLIKLIREKYGELPELSAEEFITLHKKTINSTSII